MKWLSLTKIIWGVRILAGLLVLLVVALTATLAYHVHIQPVEGKLSQIIPEPGSLNPHLEAIAYALSLEEREAPDIEPGEQAFRKAVELMSSGHMNEAHQKLTGIYNMFPNSSVAKNARRIAGAMNMDALLGSGSGFDRQTYQVKPGDSYLAIAAKHETTIEMIIHLNSMKQLKGIQPGHELVVMPLNFRILVEMRRNAVSIWDGGRFLTEYPALAMNGLPKPGTKTSIHSKIAELNGGKILSHNESHSAAEKIIQIASPKLQIRGWDKHMQDVSGSNDQLPRGILLLPHHIEELYLLTRADNIVEFR